MNQEQEFKTTLSITLGDWVVIGYGFKLFSASEDYSGEFGAVNETPVLFIEYF